MTSPQVETVVVGLTLAPASRAALAWASRYAHRTDAILHAVCIHPRAPTPVLSVSDRELNWSGQARRSVEVVFGRLKARSDWTLTQQLGLPGPDLMRLAADADLIVIGQRSPVPGLDRESVSKYCLANTSIPVVVVPGAPPARTDPAR